MDLAIVTANLGGRDELRAQTAQDLDVEWICFTDDPAPAPHPWKVIPADDRGEHPNLAAKRFKFLPPVPQRYVIWLDANMEVTSPAFAREALACIHDGLALHRHPRRDCIYAEAEASLGSESQDGRYEGLPIREQVAQYRAEGFPEKGGLFACGTIVWDQEDARVRKLGVEWMRECKKWTYQDQLSFPVVCRRLRIEPGVFPIPQITRYHPIIENPWLKIHPHL